MTPSAPWLLVVTPMPEEMKELRRRSAAGEPPAPVAALGLPWAGAGTLGGRPVLLAVSGDGARRAREGLARLLETVEAAGVIAAGVAGGLSPELAVGDLVAQASGPGLVELAAAAGAKPGQVVSRRELALTAAAKAELYQSHGSDGEPLVVDLESAAYAQTAGSSGVPWLALRVVSDTAAEELPAFLNDCFAEDGSIDRGKVARKALFSPRAMPRLLVMKNRVEACSGLLAEAIDRITAGWPEAAA